MTASTNHWTVDEMYGCTVSNNLSSQTT